jgi:hypothetical protein
LSDDEFYYRFYDRSGLPKDIPARIRRCLSHVEALADRFVPCDHLELMDDELDLVFVLEAVGEEFGVRFTKEDYPLVDGTLDNLVQLVYTRLGWPGLTLPPTGKDIGVQGSHGLSKPGPVAEAGP